MFIRLLDSQEEVKISMYDAAELETSLLLFQILSLQGKKLAV